MRAGAAKLKQVLRQACRRSMDDVANRLLQSARAVAKAMPEDIGYWKVMKQLARRLIRFLCKNWKKIVNNLWVDSSAAVTFS